MNMNPSWNYKDIIMNIRTLKLSYEERLTSFSYVCDENNFIRKTRDNLYSLNLEEFQKDRVWEYMNGYLSQFDILMFFGFLEGEEN